MNNEEKIRLRIACPEAGYPESEARYKNEEEWAEAMATVLWTVEDTFDEDI